MSASTDLRMAMEELGRELDEPAPVPFTDLGAAHDARGTLDALQERLGALPWWVISSIIHGVLVLVLGLAAGTMITVDPIDVRWVQPHMEIDPPQSPPHVEPAPVFHPPTEIDAPPSVEPLLTYEEDTPEWTHNETADDMDDHCMRGELEGLTDMPMGGTGVVSFFGVGRGAAAGAFGYRSKGGRIKMIRQGGGNRWSEGAVERALKWLAEHQEADGRWDGTRNGDARRGHGADVGLTGLATLAFLGAGYTHEVGRYRDTVRKALGWLRSCQDADEASKTRGRVYLPRKEFSGRAWWYDQGSGYGHAIAGLALAEAYGMTRDEALRAAAQAAIDYSVNVHQKRYSGWRYRPNERADLSVTGWYVMQVKSARVAGLGVDGAAEQGAKNFLSEVTDDDGSARYMPGRPATACMTSVGLVCRLFMGASNEEPLLRSAAGRLRESLPEWRKATGWDNSFYYWYYGTLGMFQMGGEEWKAWNGAMRDMLVENQCAAEDGEDLAGSWDPIGGCPSRVFSTAAGALCLEVYYRYLPMYAAP